MSHASTFQPAAAPGREPATHTGVLLRKCSCGGSCAKCREADEESLQRKAAGTPAGHEAPSIVHDVIASSGQALDAVTQSDMERRFAHDFSRVRIHTDARAAASAQAVQAHAYTVGQHVVFGAGRFAPTTHEGRHLLAHELAHTVQQENAGERRQHRLIVRDSDSADERAADRAADIAVRGGAHARPPLVTGHSTPGRALQRKGSGLLPPQKVHDVYLKWIEVYFKSRGTNVLTDALEKEIRERVKQQVGPGNFANYERWEQEEADKHWAKGQAENKPKPQPADLRSAQFERYDEMWNATKTLRAEVVRVEHLAQKLNFGKGAKGTVARATAGGYTAMYGVGARTVTSVAEHAPMFVLGGAGVMLGSEMAEEFVVKQGQAVKQEGEEMGADARTAVRLVGGDLQANFEATRPAKKKYDDAFSAFSDHSSNFKNPKGETNFEIDMARSTDLAGMEAAMKEMRTAGNEFLSICARMGIETDASALDVMGKNIMKGAEGAVETAVTGVVPELAPSLKQLKSAVKGAKKPLAKEAKEQVAKQVLKGADDVPVTGGAKNVDDAVQAGVKKADDAPISGASKPDMPVKQQASPKDAPAKIVPEADAKALRENASKVGPVTDKTAIDAGYVAEIPIGKHTYRRHKDGTWCRFSDPICNLKVDPEIEARFAKWVEAPTPQGPAKRRRPGPPPDTGHGAAARGKFDNLREGYAKQLGARSGEDVHHAIELQALDRYPGVFSERELNGFKNMRGIPAEVKLTKELEQEIAARGLKPGTKDYSDFLEPHLGTRKQLHNSKIRDTWDRHYAQLNDDIAELGLKPGTREYRMYVRRYLESARKEIDELYEAFFTEVKRGKKQWKGAAR